MWQHHATIPLETYLLFFLALKQQKTNIETETEREKSKPCKGVTVTVEKGRKIQIEIRNYSDSLPQ